MAMPVTAHSTNRFLSAFSIRTFTGFSKNRIHNKTTLAPTLTTFIPNGFAVSIVNCAPGATLVDAIVIDNGSTGKADPNDRIRLTATISNAQAADYEGTQLTLINDLLCTIP